jgi:hypothetical protein
MGCKLRILTIEEIESQVRQCAGTWVKRRNLRLKLKAQSNQAVREEMLIIKAKIRDLRAMGAREESLRHWYSQLTKFELMILE